VADKLESEIDRLYGLPLEEFTPARDELARRLRTDGDRDGAAEIKKLRKPTVTAWALNQAKRSEPKRVAGLIEAGARLRDAQERLVAGGERELLRDAAAEERRAAEAVVALAETELGQSGHVAGASAQSKLWATVRAAAVNPEASELLKAGRLTHDYEVSDLGLGSADAAAVSKRPAPRPGKPAAKGAPPAAAKGVDRRAREAERKAQAVRRRLDRARDQHQTAKERVAEARTRVSEARREAVRAASALERAEAAAEQADARAQAARTRVGELEDELSALGE
jgi:hypothetical protein